MERIFGWAIGTVALSVGSLGSSLLAAQTGGATGKPVVAILDFTNSALLDHEKYEGLSTGMAAMLITELRANPKIEVVERERIRQVLDEIGLGQSGQVDRATAVKAGKILGAHHLIFGVFVIDLKGNLRLDARSVNVETSVVEHVETVSDDADNLLRAVAQLGHQLSTGLQLPVGPAALKPSPGARRGQLLADIKFCNALREEDRKNPQKAIQLLKEFLAETPADYAPLQRQDATARIQRLSGGSDF